MVNTKEKDCPEFQTALELENEISWRFCRDSGAGVVYRAFSFEDIYLGFLVKNETMLSWEWCQSDCINLNDVEMGLIMKKIRTLEL